MHQIPTKVYSTVPTSLPPPSPTLYLKHVAIGLGTQNYTCDVTNATAGPVAIGAKAKLFNVTCVAATYPNLLDLLPKIAVGLIPTVSDVQAGQTASGWHIFLNTTTPFFDLNTPVMQLGEVACAKNNSTPAPLEAPRGLTRGGAVDWLKLVSRNGTISNLREVYRLQTAGGEAPKTCRGMPTAFEVRYAAQYVLLVLFVFYELTMI
jgi:hypothetical protein